MQVQCDILRDLREAKFKRATKVALVWSEGTVSVGSRAASGFGKVQPNLPDADWLPGMSQFLLLSPGEVSPNKYVHMQKTGSSFTGLNNYRSRNAKRLLPPRRVFRSKYPSKWARKFAL